MTQLYIQKPRNILDSLKEPPFAVPFSFTILIGFSQMTLEATSSLSSLVKTPDNSLEVCFLLLQIKVRCNYGQTEWDARSLLW